MRLCKKFKIFYGLALCLMFTQCDDGEKSHNDDTLVIKKIRPAKARPGDYLEIIGSNFDPISQNNTVLIGDKPANVYSYSSSDTMISCTIPDMAHTGPAKVTVTVDGIQSNEADITIADFWKTKGAMPTGRSSCVAVSLGNLIYVLGGFNGGNKLEMYNPNTDTWLTKANMPTSRGYFAATVANGKIYAIGGSVPVYSGFSPSSIVEEYDPNTNLWTRKADMPTARQGLVALAIDTLIYAFGGYDGGSYTKNVEVYDIKSNTWQKILNMPRTASHAGAVVWNRKIYFAGGYTHNTLEEYDPADQSWTIKSDIPHPGSGQILAVINERFYVIGNYTDEYNPANNHWTTKRPIYSLRSNFGGICLNDRIYIFGGFNNYNYSNTTEEYFPYIDE